MWTQDLWLDELDALREHLGLDECHIIGQSWGGMMQIAYAIERGAKGVKSFIILPVIQAAACGQEKECAESR